MTKWKVREEGKLKSGEIYPLDAEGSKQGLFKN